jgi:hypothetical protein
MKNTIEETTRLLLQGTLTKEEADKILLDLHNVSQQRELLIAFLEMNNWLSLEDEENAKGVVDCYLKAINCG